MRQIARAIEMDYIEFYEGVYTGVVPLVKIFNRSRYRSRCRPV